jgi:hypothetical protein
MNKTPFVASNKGTILGSLTFQKCANAKRIIDSACRGKNVTIQFSNGF